MGKNIWKVPRTSPHWKTLLKKDDSKVWRAPKVAVIHHFEK